MHVPLPFVLLASLASAADSLFGNFAVNDVVFGLNLTFGGSHHDGVVFRGGESNYYWLIKAVAQGIKSWHTIRKYSDVVGGHLYIHFNEPKAGAVARTTTGTGSIFEFEYVGEALFRFASIDSPATNPKLVWTVANNDSDSHPDLYLTLQPDRNSRYQRFSIINYPISP